MNKLLKTLADYIVHRDDRASNLNLYLNYLFKKHPNDFVEMQELFSGMPGFIYENIEVN